MSYTYDVSVILVNYNGKRYIDELFKSLSELELDGIRMQIVFVDNASNDDSIAYVKAHYNTPNLVIVESEKNLGFAGGNNLGVEHAQGEYIVLLNNDTKVDKLWLKEQYNRIKNDKTIGIINGKLLFYYDFIKIETKTQDKFKIAKKIKVNGKSYEIDNKFAKNLLLEEKMVCFGNSYFYIPLLDGECNYEVTLELTEYDNKTDYIILGEEEYTANVDGEINISLDASQIKRYKKSLIQNAGSGINENYDGYDIGMGEEDGEKFNHEYEINNACGASFMILKEDFQAVGGFDERFFMYYEDTDLSYRVKKLGKKIIYYPNSIVRHIHTGSSKEWSPFFVFHVVRNKILFVYKCISKKWAIKECIKVIVRNKDKNAKKAAIHALMMLGKMG